MAKQATPSIPIAPQRTAANAAVSSSILQTASHVATNPTLSERLGLDGISASADGQSNLARLGLTQPRRTRIEELGGLSHQRSLDIFVESSARRKTGIICTIGPSSKDPEKLVQLRAAGMNIMRLNFSHGTHAYATQLIDNLEQSFAIVPGRPVAIALDTKGPEIRTGNMVEGTNKADLATDAEVVVSVDVADRDLCSEKLIFMDYPNLPVIVPIGGTIYVDDGLIQLLVEEQLSPMKLRCRVLNGGEISSHKGVNLPGIAIDLPAVSEKDYADLRFGVEKGVDMVFASFIRNKNDVAEVRAALGPEGKDIQIISKIENIDGVKNFDEILQASDGIMVARGDLGIEIPPEKVFVAQKMMIAKSNIAGKPVICATQMLESMVKNPRPTRAEISDVANAVMDGSDCVMLSGETAKGLYPVESVAIMARTCREAESSLAYNRFYTELRDIVRCQLDLSSTETLAQAAVGATLSDPAIKVIIVLTTTGTTPRMLAKYRPYAPIVCVTRSRAAAARLHLYRGTLPAHYPLGRDPQLSWQDDVESRLAFGVQIAQHRGVVKDGQFVLFVHGFRQGQGSTNTLRIVRLEARHRKSMIAAYLPMNQVLEAKQQLSQTAKAEAAVEPASVPQADK